MGLLNWCVIFKMFVLFWLKFFSDNYLVIKWECYLCLIKGVL